MSDQLDRLSAAVGDRYLIERELGEGGMATVYLARDLRHDREVAVKVLRPELAAVIGAERFLNEIRVTANLQHPNILQVYDSGEADSLLFYVMPFVRGESLRDRLDREKQLPVDDSIEIARAVASALDYAHRQNVIHRDIKPENILLQDGQPVVADFGIALAVSTAEEARLTETGLSLGTPRYMSPEQAMGDREVDGRTDIYSLACVLHEMLLGDPPYIGATAQAIVAQILTDDPRPLTERRPGVPAHVDATVRTALARIPADRFPTAAQFADALTNPALAPRSSMEASPEAWGAKRWRATALVMAAIAVAAVALSSRPSAPRGGSGPAVYDVVLPDSAPIAFKAYRLPALAVSANGSFVVYVAQRPFGSELWFRSLLDDVARPIQGTQGADAPVLSPDDRVVAFRDGGQLKTVPVAGGTVRVIAEVSDPNGLVWVSANRLLVSDHDANVQRWIDPEAGEVSSHAGRCTLARPSADANHALCLSATRYPTLMDLRDGITARIRPQQGPDGSTAPLLAGSDFRFLGEEHVTYVARNGELRVASFDLDSRTAGRPVTMVSGVRKEALYGAAQYDISGSGTLVYAPGSNAEIGRIVEVSRDGAMKTWPMAPAPFLKFDLSPDGSTLAAVVRTVAGAELRIYDVESGRFAVWQQGLFVGEPLWSPSGDRLTVMVVAQDGGAMTLSGSPTSTAPPDTLPGRIAAPMGFAPGGRLLFWDFSAEQALLMQVGQDSQTDTLASPVYFPQLSPDGRWLAYQNAATGQLVVEPHPELDRRFHVADDAWEPRWLGPDELVYWIVDTWYRVRIGASADRPVGDPEVWFRDIRFSDTVGRSYVTTADGAAVYVQGPERTTGSYLRVVPNVVEQMTATAVGGG